MAFDNLLVRTARDINGIQIDGVLKEVTEATVRATTNPVEFGAEVSDHVIVEPRTIVIEGVVTDSPLGAAAISNIGNSIGGAFDSQTGIFGKSEERALTRSQQIYDELVQMLYKRELIEVQTKLRKYENLIFQSIIVDQDKDTSRAVFFTATFIEALLVEGAQQSTVDQDNIEEPEDANAYGDYENGGYFEAADPTPTQESVILT